VVVDLDAPVAAFAGATVEADGRRLVFSVDGSAAAVIASLAGLPELRDITIVEPDIEEVIARLYARRPTDP
jgi:ABC-2 type transport system ATP-binding protein